MKNNLIKTKILLLFMGVILLSSCSKEFLEEPKNTNGVTADVVFSDRSIVESYVTGILRNFRRQYSTVDTGGLYALYFARSIKGNDLIQSPNWYRFDYGHENREPGYRRTIFNWDYNYDQINQSNVLIKGVQESDLDDASKAEFIAVGKVLRAFHYFQLALEFAPNYNNNRSIARLPIYTEPATGASEGNPPSPLSDVYDLILSDLKEAIPVLGEDRLGKSYINKAVANGILARVLSVTQDDWSGMAAAAKAAYGGGSAASAVVSSNWGAGFDDMTDQEWIWAMYQDSNETNFYYAAPHVMIDHLVLSYQATYVNRNFVERFADTDVRKLFFDIYGVAATTPYREFITTKFDFTFEADLPIMRKSEMVLLEAEAQYHQGATGTAQDLLFDLQSARDASAVKTTSTGQALLDEILIERRKELYAEIGVEWFDAKRYSLPINRDPEHRVVVNVPADSELFFLKIPQKEIDANPNFDDSINN
ncbi:RagB/SusD family nutrient uptake outer membrane protein [Flaviramulus sp. BrNp1-15]|uniref:RagB/SusD family nutrient uptake outer membrane protein n=1 Tax=Flaviramulus sp. BrNp1-15 TaxID=2916754 RepID=UPI001EE7C49D|nr:RagB/SusD family nutrient uptake outer membrane protein [Flaviramulus sp. BrNp1-15]ULC60225.1 RagB/SusD family nutrient uptake outer membrane protein [Flaviramulus sp. BrNp1-15]